MAGQSGTSAHPLIGRLKENPYGFDFFLAARLLECAHADRPRLGESDHVSEDPVRFSQEPSLAFAPSTVWKWVDRQDDASPASPRLFVNFIGLLGPNGPMPHHVTQYARERERNIGDATLARFLDIFNHRLVCLFYRAWAAAQQPVGFDRPAEDRYAVWIGSLFGLGAETLRHRSEVPDTARLHYSGQLVCKTRHAAGLRAIIQDYFGVKAQVQEMAGQWMDLPADCRCILGRSRDTGTLGRTAIVGSRMWECQQKFRIRLGPMSFKDYQRMLPSGDSLGRLVEWIRFYTTDEFTWDLRLVLLADEIPEVRLGQAGRLGWTTWLKSKPIPHNVSDLVLRPVA